MYEWAICAVLFILLCVVYARSQVTISVEPFTQGNPKDNLDKIAAQVTHLKDTLNVATYNDKYSDILLALDEWAGLNMLDLVNSDKMAQPIDKMIDRIRMFNDVCEFKRNLNVAMTFVDKA